MRLAVASSRDDAVIIDGRSHLSFRDIRTPFIRISLISY
jgi:hypothetical protein